MSLIEVMVAAVVLLLIMIPMGILLTSISSAAVQTRQRQAAEQLADSWLQVLENTAVPVASGVPCTNTPETLVSPATTAACFPQYTGPQLADSNGQTQLSGTTFKAVSEYSTNSVNEVGQSDLCSAGSPPSPTHPDVIQLQVTVSWGNNFSQSLSQVTELNYPTPGSGQGDGYLAINVSNVQVNDALGNSWQTRLGAIPVEVTQTSIGTGGQAIAALQLYPDNNGCIFAQLPAGTYTVATVAPPQKVAIPGYAGTPSFVDQANQPSESSGVTIIAGGEQSVNLGGFDEGIASTVNFAGASAIDGGVECPDGAGLTCVTLGSGTTGASAAWGGTGAKWASTSLSNGTHLNQVDCTTAASATCVGVGYLGSSGLILATSSDLNTTTVDSVNERGLPAVTDLTQVTCPSAQGCYALGTSASGPVLLAGRVGSGTDVWANVTPTGFTGMNSIACPTSTTCEVSYATAAGAGVLRLDGDPASLGGNPSWSPTATPDVLATVAAIPYTTTSVGTITCPSASECLATAIINASGTTEPTIVDATVATSGASTWSAEATFPTNATAVTGISCAGTTCVAIGTGPRNSVGNAAVWTGDLTSTPDNWVQANGIPPSVESVGSVACGQPASSDTADCVISSESASGSGSGQLLVGSLNGNWAWNYAVPPSSPSVQYYVGVACENPPSAASSTCAAVGATANGPVVLTTSSGPKGSWIDRTPTSLAGAVVSNIPVAVAQSSTSAWIPEAATLVSGNTYSLNNPLYPWSGGYNISAGACSDGIAPSTLGAAPGGSATAPVPLGLLPLQLVYSAAGPIAPGASMTLTDWTCGSAGTIYNLPVTDATGVTMTSVPYGTYKYSVTVGGTAITPTQTTLTVGPNSITVTGGLSTGTVTDFLPGVVEVQA